MKSMIPLFPPQRLYAIDAIFPQIVLCMSIRSYFVGSPFIVVIVGTNLCDIVRVFLEIFLLESYSSLLKF